jgi:glutamyl-tRNA reductase
MHTLNIRVTHKKADIQTLEAISFPDIKKTMIDIYNLPSVKECVIIQTCNRVEIFAAGKDCDLVYHDIIDYLMENTMDKMRKAHPVPPDMSPQMLMSHVVKKAKGVHDVIETDFHTDALYHLLRLTSGLESMIVGEDQIQGQVRDSYHLATSANTMGPFLKNIFTKALHVGQRVRSETSINEGAVSIGSAAVELAESIFGTLKGKTVMLIGAGEMGSLVAKSLGEHEIKGLIVANRTHARGVKIAESLNGKAVKFNEVEDWIKKSDLIITATGAPRAILSAKKIEKATKGRKKDLVIIDVATPRDVDEKAGDLPHVKLYNIDGLRDVADKNQALREKEAVKAEEIIEEDISLLVKQIYHIDVEDVVKTLFNNAEKIRERELAKALKMLNSMNGKEKQVLDDLTRVITTRTVTPIAAEIRRAAEVGDKDTIKAAEKLIIKHHHKKYRE